MLFTKINRQAFAYLKKSIRQVLSGVGSAHADEALAAYLGHRTYASLLSVLPASPAFLEVAPDSDALARRLRALGHKVTPEELARVEGLYRSGLFDKGIREMAQQAANDNRPT